MARKPKTRIRIGLPKDHPTPSWTVLDLGYGQDEAQMGRDIVEAMRAKGYQADGQTLNEVEEDF